MANLILLAIVAALYLLGVRRYDSAHAGHAFRKRRAASFLAGLLVIAAAVASPLEQKAEASFPAHMVQHLLLTMIAAPLLLGGAPLFLARRATPPGVRRIVLAALRSRATELLTFPPVAWGVLPALMWASHFSSFYDAALRHELLHSLEHVLYLGAALLFWFPVLGVDPARWRLSHPARLVYVFLSLPANTLLGLALYSSRRPLYPTYAGMAGGGSAALEDQKAGALVMWLVGDIVMLAALLLVAASWARRSFELRAEANQGVGRDGEEQQREVRDGVPEQPHGPWRAGFPP